MFAFDKYWNLLSLIYIIPSLLLYILLLYLIIFSSAKNKFTNSFYWIYRFSAINYCIHVICYYIIYRFTKTPLFYQFLKTWPIESPFYIVIWALSFYSFSAMHIYNLAISFNRVTVFVLKTNYENFWKKYLKLVLSFCIFTPLIFVWHFHLLEIKMHSYSDGGFFIQASNINFIQWWQPYRNAVIEIFITSLLSLGMNIYVLFGIFRLRYSKSNIFQISSQELALIPYSLLLFSMEIMHLALQLLLVINNDYFLPFVLSAQSIIVDITDLTPVWLVLITNKSLRNELLSLFTKCFPKNNVSVDNRIFVV